MRGMPRYREPLDSVVYRFLFASPLPVRRNLLANGTHPPAPYWRAPSFFFIEKGAQAVDLQCVERRCERMTPGFPFVPLEYWKADRCPAREPTVESMAYRFQKKKGQTIVWPPRSHRIGDTDIPAPHALFSSRSPQRFPMSPLCPVSPDTAKVNCK